MPDEQIRSRAYTVTGMCLRNDATGLFNAFILAGCEVTMSSLPSVCRLHLAWRRRQASRSATGAG